MCIIGSEHNGSGRTSGFIKTAARATSVRRHTKHGNKNRDVKASRYILMLEDRVSEELHSGCAGKASGNSWREEREVR